MVPIVFALVPTIIGAAMLVGLNDSGSKGVLLFGTCPIYPYSINVLTYPRIAVYLIGTFGSALSTIYAYNASNISGHTKKARPSTLNHLCLSDPSITEHDQRHDTCVLCAG